MAEKKSTEFFRTIELLVSFPEKDEEKAKGFIDTVLLQARLEGIPLFVRKKAVRKASPDEVAGLKTGITRKMKQ